MVKFKLLAIAFFLSFQSCYVLFDQAVLPVPEDITNKGIKLDGYYHTIYKFENESLYSLPDVVIPYKNGVYKGGVNYGVGAIMRNYEQLFIEADKHLHLISKTPSYSKSWGTLAFSSDSIILRSVGGRFGDCIQTYVGKVLNDTTFTITYRSSTRCAGDSYEERQPDTLNLLFHFRKFGPKPDSSAYTNYLLKANNKK